VTKFFCKEICGQEKTGNYPFSASSHLVKRFPATEK